MKKIAIIIPKLTGGGAERVASNLSLFLPKEYKKYIVLYEGDKIDYPYEGEIIDLKTKRKRDIPSKFITFLKRLYKIQKLKKKYKIDTTISFLENPNLINILTKKNDKVIVSVRNYLSKSSTGLYGKIHNRLIRILYNKADLIVAVSKEIQQDLVLKFNIEERKIVVIYNPYDINKIGELAKEQIEKEYQYLFDNPVVVNVGRLNIQKGQWQLIRAFKRVVEIIPDAKLLILGDGELKGHYQNLISDLELSDSIFLIGFKENPFKYIARSTIYAFPSLYEGFPNALVEAMACGIPVISADCKSGPREILMPNKDFNKKATEIEYGEYGILLPVGQEKEYTKTNKLTREEDLLAQSILTMLQNKEQREHFSKKAQKRARDFENHNIIYEWIKLL